MGWLHIRYIACVGKLPSTPVLVFGAPSNEKQSSLILLWPRVRMADFSLTCENRIPSNLSGWSNSLLTCVK